MSMEKGPKFRVTHETAYCPHLERVNDTVAEPGPKTEEQKNGLRAALLKAARAGAFVGALAAGNDIGKGFDRDLEAPDPAYTTTAHAAAPGHKYALQAKAGKGDRTDAAGLDDRRDEAQPLTAFEQAVLQQRHAFKPEDVEQTLQRALEPAEGTNGLGPLFYAQKVFAFDKDTAEAHGWTQVPDAVWQELEKVIPGWIGQESRFDEQAASSSNAIGWLQFKENAWEDTGRTGQISRQLGDQLAATKDLVVKNYRYILGQVQPAGMEKLQAQFATEEDFSRHLIAPLLITAHNAGGPGVGRELQRFVETVAPEEMATGKDLFWQFITASQLSGEAKEYAKKVFGLSLALQEAYEQRQS